MSGTVAVKCRCANEYQDKRYGQGIRIANKTARENEARCTVCGATVTGNFGPPAKKGKK